MAGSVMWQSPELSRPFRLALLGGEVREALCAVFLVKNLYQWIVFVQAMRHYCALGKKNAGRKARQVQQGGEGDERKSIVAFDT
ncbi:hypothetical protein K3729_09685 [Rhodobacteraceae bacterium S2214]|nr:hypothetical protein K3729_09685 [Rhodobacteraceae bacterium S2214]